ncbi:hypothetical protein Ancab_036054, partial [Ancistrocladus abbreviatus]
PDPSCSCLSLLTPHSSRSSISHSQSVISHVGDEAPQSLLLTQPHTHSRQISFSVLTQRLLASHLSRRRRSLSVLSPHCQPVIPHTGDEALRSSLSPTQSADLTLSPQSSQAAASILADLTLRPHSQAFSPREPNNYHSFRL